MLETAHPFVLLDDAGGPDARCRLYRGPEAIVTAQTEEQVAPALERLRAAVAQGRHAAGYLAYEAGRPLVQPGSGHVAAPLLWFGLFDRVEELASAQVAAMLPDPAGGWLGAPQPRIARTAYDAAIGRVKAYIAAGDIYQANLTFRADVALQGDPLACYAAMRAVSAARWGGVVWTGQRWLLSLSPELFFECEGGRLVARPMKGTTARAADDWAAIAALRSDPKQRAENLMIVDLLRNDLSRVAAVGSVEVPRLFEVETYPTLHTMTSTVEAELAPGRDAIDLLAAAYPCGSVTGAPKRRAMEVIAEVEPDARGPYTGSIGFLGPDGSARFNVAIRTLALEAGSETATLGLGSGVVADSEAGAEWRECLAKGRFVTAGVKPFDLVETMRFDAMDGLLHLERHLQRMKASAAAFGFRMDHHGIRNELQAATFRLREAARVRLRLSPSGAVAIEVSALPPALAQAAVALAPLPVSPADLRLRHKTSRRDFYDAAHAAAGTDEVVFVDPAGFLTEGSFTNVFVVRDGRMLTPPLSRGLLPGVLRAALIERGDAVEADLTPQDLQHGFLIGNALRDLIPARLVAGAGHGG